MYDELSEEDIRKMQEEIEHRKLVVRPEILKALKEARAQGDLSENFEYHAAKSEKSKNDSRIRYLENMIKTAKIVKDESAEDEVGLNNTVTVYFIDDDEEDTYRIVTSVRGDTLNNLVPMEAPLAQALLGHKVGDVVHVTVNEDYGYDVKITKLVKTTDESGDKISGY